MKTKTQKELVLSEPLEYRVVCYTNPQGKEYHIHRLEANTYKVTTTTGPWWNRKSVFTDKSVKEQTRVFTDGRILSKDLFPYGYKLDAAYRNPKSLEEAIALIEYHIAPTEEETVYKVEVNKITK